MLWFVGNCLIKWVSILGAVALKSTLSFLKDDTTLVNNPKCRTLAGTNQCEAVLALTFVSVTDRPQFADLLIRKQPLIAILVVKRRAQTKTDRTRSDKEKSRMGPKSSLS